MLTPAPAMREFSEFIALITAADVKLADPEFHSKDESYFDAIMRARRRTSRRSHPAHN